MSGFNPLDAPYRVDFEVYGDSRTESERRVPIPEQLVEAKDPIVILCLCEEIDEEEGRAPGTTLRMYLYELKTTR